MTDPIHPVQEDELHAFVDNRLGPARQAEVERLLMQDPALRQRVEAWRRQSEGLRAAFAFKAREPVPRSLHFGRLLEARLSRTTPWRVAAGLVLALSIGAAGGWAVRGPQPRTDMAWLTAQAASAHRVFATDDTRPVELKSDDKAAFVTWMTERLGHHVGVPNLTTFGYHFVGGRVLAAVGGPAAMLMYDDDSGTRITVYVQPMHGAPIVPMRRVADSAVSGYAWINGQVGYSVMSDQDEQAIHTLANKVRDDMKSTT